MPDRPRVSIVTPSYNQAPFLEETLRSVEFQTYRPIEHIVMDGGSTDGSVEILSRHALRLAHWESAPDQGFADALRRGFERASGEILAYLNSDDALAPRAVEEAVRFLREHPEVVLVYGNRVCVDERGRLLYLRPALPFGAPSPYAYMVLGQETCFWRREAYERAGGIDPTLRFAVDFDLFSRIARVGPIGHCGSVWGYFRKHHASKTMSAFESIGVEEVARIQEARWGRVAPASTTRMVALACRAYAATYGAYLELAAWPRGVPRPPGAPFADRVGEGLRRNDLIRRALERLGVRRG